MDDANPDAIKGNINVRIGLDLSRKELSYLLCSAVEGGTNYWAKVSNLVRTPNLDYVSVRFHEQRFYEEETSNGPKPKVQTVTLESLAAGIARALSSGTKGVRRHAVNFLTGDWDAETADVLVQYTIFGDIIYG